MTKSNQGTEPFFITPEIAAEMTADGYEFEPPSTPCTTHLRDLLRGMSEAELELLPDNIAGQERERRLLILNSAS